MTRAILPMMGVAIFMAVLGASVAPSPAFADTIFDVEHARATLRAGRPISDHDAEYLERWGALSGSEGRRFRYNDGPDYDAYSYEERRSYRPRNHRSRR